MHYRNKFTRIFALSSVKMIQIERSHSYHYVTMGIQINSFFFFSPPCIFDRCEKFQSTQKFWPTSDTALSTSTPVQSKIYKFSTICLYHVHWHCKARKQSCQCGSLWGRPWVAGDSLDYICTKYWKTGLAENVPPILWHQKSNVPVFKQMFSPYSNVKISRKPFQEKSEECWKRVNWTNCSLDIKVIAVHNFIIMYVMKYPTATLLGTLNFILQHPN